MDFLHTMTYVIYTIGRFAHFLSLIDEKIIIYLRKKNRDKADIGNGGVVWCA